MDDWKRIDYWALRDAYCYLNRLCMVWRQRANERRYGRYMRATGRLN